MPYRKNDWENELWSYLNNSDGIHCPVYESCKLRLSGGECLSEHEEHYHKINLSFDRDYIKSNWVKVDRREVEDCPSKSRIFNLVGMLATKYRQKAGVTEIPVPTDLIIHTDDSLPIEVRHVSLKAYHGATWKLDKCWLIYLNRNDSKARRRFTLYHEIFHVLAHTKSNPIFKKEYGSLKGSFNEILADHFSCIMLLPEDWLIKTWLEVKDINQVAALFEVPSMLVWSSLRRMCLL